MDTTISTPSAIYSISKNKKYFDVISSDNTVIDILTTSPSSFFSPYKETPGLRNHHTYVDYLSITGKIGTDQTGQFIVPSVRGNNYLLIVFHLDSNSIFSELIPNCTKYSNKISYANILKILKSRELKPQLYR